MTNEPGDEGYGAFDKLIKLSLLLQESMQSCFIPLPMIAGGKYIFLRGNFVLCPRVFPTLAYTIDWEHWV